MRAARTAVLALCALNLAIGGRVASAASSEWPSGPVHIVVAQSPGGPPDLIARFVADRLERRLGVAVIVENRPGAAGIVGMTSAARAVADGYTLAIGTLSTHVLVPATNPQAGYDPRRDFVPVINLFRSVKVLWIDATLPVRSFKDWIDYAAARPGRLNFASGGVGSSNHVDMSLLNRAFGIDAVHVPFNGPAAGIAAVAAGSAQAMIVSVGSGLALAQAGRVRPLATFATRRAPLLPDVPTASEAGAGAIDLGAWIGLFAPAGTPEGIVHRLNAELATIVAAPDALAWANAQGLEIVGGSAAAFAATLASDQRRWTEAIRRVQPAAE